MRTKSVLAVFLSVACSAASSAELGEDGFADSGGVKIHYVTLGKGPLIILLHGFPDFWYTWREQMPALAKHFQVVAVDLFDKPARLTCST